MPDDEITLVGAQQGRAFAAGCAALISVAIAMSAAAYSLVLPQTPQSRVVPVVRVVAAVWLLLALVFLRLKSKRKDHSGAMDTLAYTAGFVVVVGLFALAFLAG